MEILESILKIIAVAAVLIGNILWYIIKFINRSNGHQAMLFFHMGDFKNFKKVINAESDPKKVSKYKLLLLTTRICIITLIISFIGITIIMHNG